MSVSVVLRPMTFIENCEGFSLRNRPLSGQVAMCEPAMLVFRMCKAVCILQHDIYHYRIAVHYQLLKFNEGTVMDVIMYVDEVKNTNIIHT